MRFSEAERLLGGGQGAQRGEEGLHEVVGGGTERGERGKKRGECQWTQRERGGTTGQDKPWGVMTMHAVRHMHATCMPQHCTSWPQCASPTLHERNIYDFNFIQSALSLSLTATLEWLPGCLLIGRLALPDLIGWPLRR